MDIFLQEHRYIDYNAPNIQAKATSLFDSMTNDVQKAKVAYEFVRDEIPHMFDIKSEIVTVKASDVLEYKTGICQAKSNLLAALLRLHNIPTGFCFQRLYRPEHSVYAVHCYNAIYLNNRWIKVDARGNKPGVNAQFSLDVPMLAYLCNPEYGEYFWPGIYASPHEETMQMLEQATNLRDVFFNIPNTITESPEVTEENG